MGATHAAPTRWRRVSTRTLVLAGMAVALLLAFAVAPHASSSPDGLEKVAAENGIDTAVGDHALAGGPLADYTVGGVEDASISTGVAGVVGVAVTGALGAALFAALRVGRRGTAATRQDIAPEIGAA